MDRRDFLTASAQACYGVTFGASAAHFLGSSAHAAPTANAPAKSVIYLFINGGLTHLDSFDPKPDAAPEITGGKRAIGTNVDGIQLSEYFPQLAQHADKLCLIRGMNSTQGAHEQGRYFMRTGYEKRSSIVHPAPGSWLQRLATPDADEQSLPGYITVAAASDHPRNGFLEPAYAPLPIGDANDGLRNSQRPRHLDDAQFARQIALRTQLDARFDDQFSANNRSVRAHDEVFRATLQVMASKDLKAFDLSKESPATTALYGKEKFARGCLLARRLVEHGTRFVEVEFGGFDWHDDAFVKADDKLPVLDRALSALLHDLDSRGLLDSTLVVLATEFGRTPEINQNSGRDHYPKAFSTLMAGGGIKGGHIHGETDATGSEVLTGKCTAKDINATIAKACGLDSSEVIYSPSRRPFSMNGKTGKSIPIFA